MVSFARSVTGIIVVIGKGVWVCPKELCARAERGSQDRQNKYSHHLAIITFLWFSRCYSFQNCSDVGCSRLLVQCIIDLVSDNLLSLQGVNKRVEIGAA